MRSAQEDNSTVGRGSIVAEPNVVNDDDHRLVAAVRRGDDRAFEALYSRYHRRIHAYVMGMVKDHGRTEDITQEVFVSALRRMRETERPIAFKPWVYEIAKNACIDQFRRSKRAEEVSLQAEDGLAPADYGRLVGSDPAPHDAVAAKQELDNLCGAFGGLSDTHHEILVMRELEGLSYREIGDRLGMSRPAVESTLFRARRRLTEEYDELVSGARCLRIQNLIATAAESRLGTRESRRLSRHVAYCQPCRREAMAAGLDAAILTHVPLRKRAARKVAGLLPFPIFERWLAQAPAVSDQAASGWAKLATAAAVVVAGVGAAGVGTHVIGGGGGDNAGPKRAVALPAAAKSAPAPAASDRQTAGAPAKTTAKSGSGKASKRSTKRSGGTRNAGSGAGTPAAGGTGGDSGGGTTAASSNGGGGGGSKLPAVNLPVSGGDPTAPVKQTVDNVVQSVPPVVNSVTQTVEEVAAPVTNTVNQVGDTVEDGTGIDLP
ncbi:MAG TPA: sigma-70 family RNA polymerase sigma factor [Solirubrobacteraceae bacterium]|nr:sigma-70 family RNA polymerase sigma factor [Solirubrobacteraceae bacterium]